MKHKKPKKIFVDGPIPPQKIADSIANHQSKTDIGAHQIFLGQVRADELNNSVVNAIEYTAYEDMAEKEVHKIREEAFEKFDLSCMHIYHSLGKVEVGQLCFFVFVSSPHREASMEASKFLVNRIKADVPIFGKELVAQGDDSWKINK